MTIHVDIDEKSIDEFLDENKDALFNMLKNAGLLKPNRKRGTKMVKNKQSWKEFKDTGLLWYINMILHLFGWAIVLEVNKNTDEIVSAYPQRVKYRGFPEKDNIDGYIKVSDYLKDNINKLDKEAKN